MFNTKRVFVLILLGLFAVPFAALAEDRTRCHIKDSRASIREGRRLYLESGCMTCHSIQGKGGTTGPALDDVGKRHDAAYIEAKIRDPQAHPDLKLVKGRSKAKSKSKMIQADLFDDQIKSLRAYLMSLTSSGR